jgi:uncharacterized protein with FMN-binding domain
MRRAIFAVLGTIAGLVGLLSFKTNSASVATAPAAISAGPATSSGSAPSPSAPASSTSASSATSSASTSSAAQATTKTVTGDSTDTRWGPVQVKITVTNGKITSATAVDYPTNNGRDQEINSSAIPTLVQESIGKTNAEIDAVSGATYTSDGYIQSLQSALDKL